LAGAGFSIGRQKTKLTALSGGQKMRLAMLSLRLEKPNFYLLDKPTNHLDIEGLEALEDELTAHDATSLLVPHDHTFVREVGSRFWLIDGKRLREIESPEVFFVQSLAAEASAHRGEAEATAASRPVFQLAGKRAFAERGGFV